ncbi:MAG: membrane protein insertion efficiency factor YidD [Patescibacteria group bacterium]|jgi:hypothetical protein
MLKTLVLKTIRLYQKTLSPDQGWFRIYFPHGFCRFHPHCSEYGYQAIHKYGVLKGGAKTTWRVVRCNPLSKGGYDPIK